jgi:hypothetical protein
MQYFSPENLGTVVLLRLMPMRKNLSGKPRTTIREGQSLVVD